MRVIRKLWIMIRGPKLGRVTLEIRMESLEERVEKLERGLIEQARSKGFLRWRR